MPRQPPDDDPRTPARDLCLDAHGHGCFAVDLDGHVQGFVPSVRDRLIERGVLVQRADTRWYLSWHGWDLDRERAADMACCDFCAARPVGWLVPCPSFLLPTLPGLPSPMSEGDWAACEPCGSWIAEATYQSKARLLARAGQATGRAYPEAADDPTLRQQLWRMQQTLHARFWRRYPGGAVRIPAHPYGH